MSIVEFDGPPSWSLDANETEESTKCPRLGVVEITAGEKKQNKTKQNKNTYWECNISFILSHEKPFTSRSNLFNLS